MQMTSHRIAITAHSRRGWTLQYQLLLLGLALLSACTATASEPATQGCRVEGIANELQCGVVHRALDPLRPGGPQIDVHYLVVPAVARNKLPDAVLMLAGGPGQSAISVAPAITPRLARLNNRRDLVFIDQRGTGRSAPLQCADESLLPVEQAMDPALQVKRLQRCNESLGKLPHGDMRYYTTTIAMQDFDAVREQLGVPQWNLIGASYGTRAALEYQRQFPARVRRTVLDGVAPPDMVLPASFSTDAQSALDALLLACEAHADDNNACARRFPRLRQEWATVLASLPRRISVHHPLSGAMETFTLTRDAILRAVRTPLYAPALASALPAAIHNAASGDFEGLVGLANALGSSKSLRLAMGMHFSVVCAEDIPRLTAAATQAGADFGATDADFYAGICSFWPKGAVDAAFYQVPRARSPVLLLSGGIDPATPPRHGARVAQALGEKAQHVVVPQAGHGVMAIGCMRDVVFRFIMAASDAQALPQDASCAMHIPRPAAFLPVQPRTTEADAS
jgi:pimeloyl-ACP methyl ester carboxylesterase